MTISSVAGTRGGFTGHPYGASKGAMLIDDGLATAVIGCSESLA